MTDTAPTTEKPETKPAKPETAGLFTMTLPNGVRVGNASLADLEAALPVYAAQSSYRGRLVRELMALATRFDRGTFGD